MDNFNLGIIGNCKSAALVTDKGSIVWACLPEFDSSSVFAKILDENIGGEFAIETDAEYNVSQKYIKNTNILSTRYENGNDVFVVFDFMPRFKKEDGNYYCPPDIIRYVKHISGSPVFKVRYNPRLNYAKNETINNSKTEYIKSYTRKGNYESVYLYTDLDYEDILKTREINLKSDAFFLLSYNQKILHPVRERMYLMFQRTKTYWLNWTNETGDFKKYNDEIRRSALVLKLLTYQKTGSILAAITTSLPETIGEIRNWDYRFCWIRDASMIIKVLRNLGHNKSAKRFLNFIIDLTRAKDEKIQIMYGIRGEKRLTERILDHLSGYKKSAPVRVGNDAYKQKQNDIYGVLMDVLHQNFLVYHTSLENSEELWTIVRSIVKIVRNNWHKPDRGIWELRLVNKHFTFSKVLCWVAIDRAVKIAQILGKNDYAFDWMKLKDRIKEDIHRNAWNDEKKAFTQSYGSDSLDASTLLIEPYGFIEAHDPKYISTVEATKKELCHNGLMFRYKNKDDFGEPSSSFTICTFWMIRSLYKIGQKHEAEAMFKQVLNYSNHLGLFSEDIDFKTKRLLGNFPQGYSHLALIEVAMDMSGGKTIENRIIEALK